MNRQDFLYGAGVRASDGRFDEVASGLVFSPLHQFDYLFSAFFQDEFTLVRNKLTLTAGSKILRTNYTGIEFEPSVRLLWTPTDRQSFWASYTHALRTPSDAEEDFYLSSFIGTAANGLPIFARFNANPNYAPEKLNGYEIGYRKLIGKGFYFDLAGFFNHYHDLFSEDLAGALSIQTTLPFPGTPPPSGYVLLPAQFRNDLRGRTEGFEVAPEWRPASFWRLRASYSFLDMHLDKVPGTPELGTAPTIDGTSPRHEANVQSSFDISKKLQLDLIYRYVSSLPAQDVAAYSTGDVRFAWRFSRNFEFSLVGRNLFSLTMSNTSPILAGRSQSGGASSRPWPG